MSWLTRLRRILSLSCEEAAELSSQRMDEPLGWSDKLAWAGHLLVCRSCRQFRRQLAFLREAARRVAADDALAVAEDEGLSDERRASISQAMRDVAPE